MMQKKVIVTCTNCGKQKEVYEHSVKTKKSWGKKDSFCNISCYRQYSKKI